MVNVCVLRCVGTVRSQSSAAVGEESMRRNIRRQAGAQVAADADRRHLLGAFLLLPFATKKRKPAKKAATKSPTTKSPTTIAVATSLAPPLTLAPANTPGTTAPSPVAPTATSPALAFTTTLTAADVAARNGASIAVPEARAFLVGLTPERVAAVRGLLPAALAPSLDLGVLAVSTTCTHMGCTTALCASSGWWECPCHASRFDSLGFRRSGPAPAGLGYVPVTAGPDGKLTLDARSTIPGVSAATPFVAADAVGPACAS